MNGQIHKTLLGVFLLLSAALVLRATSADASAPVLGLVAYDLRCDTTENPLGIDSALPRLSWKLRSEEPDQRQTAWQVLAASAPEVLAQDRGDLWDSGRQTGNEQLNLSYAGRALRSSERVFWKVRAWDREGKVSAWSEPAEWTMGVLTAPEWGARWITDGELLRWCRARLGFRSQPAPDANAEKWILIDLGRPQPITAIRLYPMRQGVEEGMGFPPRFVIEAAATEDFRAPVVIADHAEKPFSWASTPEKTTVPTFRAKAALIARYVRITTRQLRRAEGEFNFALSQLEVLAEGKNVAVGARVKASDSIESDRWGLSAITDGLHGLDANPRDNGTLLVRREFRVRPALRRALLHISGLGHYEVSVNGRRVGNDILSPGWTTYEKTALYETCDITALVGTGENALGVILAGGLYNVRPGRYAKFESTFRPPTLIAQLRLEYADGTVETLGTDERWQVASGPITFSNAYGGEDYDARRESVGWAQPGFNAVGWSAAAAWSGPGGELRGASHAAPPIRAQERFAPVAQQTLRPGVTVYDLGQNVALMPRLRVRGPAGSVVRVIPAELVAADGSVDRSSCSRGPYGAWWQYTLQGAAEGEEWFPKFFYHGARYLQVELSAAEDESSVPGELPVVDMLEGVAVYSASPPAGEFACSNGLFNRIRQLVLWAQRSNTMSVFTDCPHREKLGWLEQYHLNGPALRYEHNVTRLFNKTFDDMADAQTPAGLVPDIAPEYVIFSGGFRDSPEWGGALLLAAWQHYLWSGDRAPVERHYVAMRRYVAYLRGQLHGGLLTHGLGDWYDLGPKPPGSAQLTPVSLTATAFYHEDLATLARFADLLGRGAEAVAFREEAAQVKADFNRAFYDAARGSYATGSQCANALPLVFGLVEPAERPRVVAALVADVQAKGLTAGDVGYRYLLRALANAGRSDVVFALNNQSEKPGYGYQLAKGATSLTEAWDARRGSSQNHFMLGQITEWFYHDVAGIQPDPAAPGFGHVIIRPAPVGDLTWARASYDSVRGPISVHWQREGRDLTLAVTLPPNTTATIQVPGEPNAREVGSGSHHFTSRLP